MIYVADAMDVLVPLAAVGTVVLTVGASGLARVSPPDQVVRLLSAAAAGATLSLAAGMVAVLGTLLARMPVMAAWGHWAAAALPEPGMSWVWALPVALTVTALLLAGARHLAFVLHQLRLAQDACRTLATSAASASRLVDAPTVIGDGLPGAEWIIVDDEVPAAYAVPGHARLHPRQAWRPRHNTRGAARSTGQIVVSRGMLEALTPAQQRVLLEHERAHLRQRHYIWIQLSEVMAVLNPSLRKVPSLVRAAAERQADLIAAAHVGDATLTARTIATAALARTRALNGSSAVTHPPQATGGDVVQRVEELLHPSSGHQGRLGVIVLSAVIVLSSLTSVGTVYSLTARLQHARERTAVSLASR